MTVQGYKSSQSGHYSNAGSIFRMATLNDRAISNISKEYARGAVKKTPIGIASEALLPGAVIILSGIYAAKKGKLDSGDVAKFSDKLLDGIKYSSAILFGAKAADAYTEVISTALSNKKSDGEQNAKHPYALATAIFTGVVGIFGLSYSLVKSGFKNFSNTKLWVKAAEKINKKAADFTAKHSDTINDIKSSLQKHPKIASFVKKHAESLTVLGFVGANVAIAPKYIEEKLNIMNDTASNLVDARERARITLALHSAANKIIGNE